MEARETQSAEIIDSLIKEAHEIAKANGFHDEKRPDYHYLMLIVCEVAEAIEADRQGKHANFDGFDELLKTVSFEELFKVRVKDTVEDELADVCIRIFDVLGLRGRKYNPEELGDELRIKSLLTSTTKYASFVALGPAAMAYEDLSDDDDYTQDLLEEVLSDTLMLTFLYCKYNNIDIMRHIRLKMDYNKTRPYRHGKQY